MTMEREEPAEDQVELVEAVRGVIRRRAHIAPQEISVVVEGECVHLHGKVPWLETIREAEKEILALPGVRSVSNHLRVKPLESAQDLKARIVDAIVRQAYLDSTRIAVEMRGSEVLLGGTVASRWEEEIAVRVATCTPGVGSVTDEIKLKASA